MKKTLGRALAVMAGAVVLGGCDSVVDGGTTPEGVQFDYSGAAGGTFTSTGMVASIDALPELGSFAMAQRDSIGGLLLGSFRRTEPGRGDLLILQIRDDQPGSYQCASVAAGPDCYGHLFLGIEATGGTATAQSVFGVSTGDVELSQVAAGSVSGEFSLTLRDLDDPSATVTIANGSLDVPLVQGVFNASFSCLLTRLQEGPQASCD
jgi:hypothetical protein